MNEQKEGKLYSGENKTSVNEGLSAISATEDSQIANIEKQLKKAQETLGDLQALKTKLEEDRRKKQVEEKKHTEMLNAVKVNEENVKLKTELKTYQGEIGSLKEMIASLKDDLVSSTEQLQKKVANSLKILEDADASLKNSSLATSEEEGFAEHDASAPIVPVAPTITAVETPVVSTEPIPTSTEQASSLNHSTSPSEESSTSPVVATNTTETSVIVPIITSPDRLKVADDAIKPNLQEISIEDELNEYKRIKEELSAMESGDVAVNESEINQMRPPVAQVAADPKNVIIPVKFVPKEEKIEEKLNQSEPGKEKKKGFLFFRKKDKSSSATEEKKAEPIKIEEKKDNKPEVKETPKVEEKSQEKKEPEKKGKLVRLFKKRDKQNKSKDHEDKTKVKADTSSGGLLIKTAVLLIVLFSGGVVYQIKNAENTRKIYIDQVQGQVKGAADSKLSLGKTSSDPEDRYKEAFVDAPFENSVWVPFNDNDYGIKIEYSKNTSFLYQPLGSTNVWFLRKNGYLMKIDKTTTTQTLEQFIATQKSDIEYSSEVTTFKGFPAIHLIQKEYMEVTGNTYFIKAGGDIFKVWYKTYNPGENNDDDQRVKHMLDTLDFTKVRPVSVKAKKTK